MRWRLTYVLQSCGLTENESPWTDRTHIWNMDDIETDIDATEKAKTFLESLVRRNRSVQSYELVRVIQEEVTVPVVMPRLKSYTELRWPKETS